MSRFRLMLQGLRFYWRTHLAVMLGVIAGAAVIGGALIVGDSVRASLRQMTLDRLGRIEMAMSGGQFVTEDLAARLEQELSTGGLRYAPAMALQGGLTHRTGQGLNRAGGVNIFGADERLWSMLEHGRLAAPKAGSVLLNRRVAEALKVKAGDAVSLNLEVPSAIPRESLLGERDDLSRELPLTVAEIIDDELGAARFGLNPSQQIPPVAFVNLDDLQNMLGLAAVPVSRRNPVAKPARVNSIFVSPAEGADGNATAEADSAAEANSAAEAGSPAETGSAAEAERLTAALKRELTLEDLGLRIVTVPERGYLSLESTRMILERSTAEAAADAAKELNVMASPLYVYLVNEFDSITGSDEAASAENYAMYSVVAGIDFRALQPPLGPFEYVAGGPAQGDREVVLNQFIADEQLKVKVGDEIAMKYYAVGSHGELPEETRRFKVSGIVKLEGAAADRNLTPMLEGITDADTFGDWDQPFEMDLTRITAADETYWDEHRATPKAFLPLEVAQDLFRSRYGNATSVRVALPEGAAGDEAAMEAFRDRFTAKLLQSIDPVPLGIAFQPVRAQGLQAASGTTDFSGLFIGFSFFLILSAAILIGLLFRLGIERRANQVGLLEVLGYRGAGVRRLFLGEGLVVVLVGAVLGTIAAVGYAALMVHGLTTWWVGAIGTRFLFLAVTPQSLAIGFLSAVFVAMVAVWWGLRRLKKVSPRALLAGATAPEFSAKRERRRGNRTKLAAVVTGGIALLLVIGGWLDLIPSSEAFGGFSWQVVSFFVAGILLLTAALTGLSWWLSRDRRGDVHTAAGLGLRNAARERLRSVATVALVASATFVLVAVAASRRDPSAELPKKDSGNGGFLLVSQSSGSLPFDLNTADGRTKLGLQLSEAESGLLAKTETVSFRRRPGDDASCLNLYQTGLPTVLGAPQMMIERGGFKFIGADRENPWTLLEEELPPTDVNGRKVPTFPVLGDANTLMYSLKKGVGQTIAVPNEQNPDYLLQVAGMFDGSVFQGLLILSEANFLRLYPDLSGYSYFLIDGPVDRQAELSNLLESQLAPYGFDAEPVADRIADFLTVQNTYLSTFQTLGGLGLLLGTVGLGTVMLRNILERRSELALLRAVGYRNGKLALLVLIENALLLLWGLVAGTVAALLAVSPHLASRGADVPIASGFWMLVAVGMLGMLSAAFAVRAAVQTPIVGTLRGE